MFTKKTKIVATEVVEAPKKPNCVCDRCRVPEVNRPPAKEAAQEQYKLS